MYLFEVIVFVVSIHVSLAVKGQQLQQQCECGGGTSPIIIGTGAVAFNPYNDNNCKLDTSKIKPYAEILQKAGLNCVIINAPEGGGSLLTMSEQKLMIKSWCENKKSNGFPYTLICQIPTSDNYNDSLDLAKYAKRSCCDVIAAGAPLDYPPNDIDALVSYLSGITKTCYPKPFVFAAPLFPECEYIYNSAKLFSCMCKASENFRGIFTNFIDTLRIQAVNDMYPDKMLVSTTSSDIVGAASFCLNGSATTLANIMPKAVVQIIQSVFSGQLEKANAMQKDLNAFYFKCLNLINEPEKYERSDLPRVLQIERMLMKIIHGLDLGIISTPPYQKLNRDQVLKLYKICEDAGVATTFPYDLESYINNDNDQYIGLSKKVKDKNYAENYGSKYLLQAFT